MASSIIAHSIAGLDVGQRGDDGYINATALSTAHKQKTGKRKDVADWLKLEKTKEDLEHLFSITGIPVIQLYQAIGGSPANGGGTWIHPKLAVRFAVWLSSEFGFAVECWVENWLSQGAIATQPMSMAELAVYSAQKLLEQDRRLSVIEQQNQLLIEENQYLKTQVLLLQSAQEAVELETEANAAELDRFRNGHGRYYTVAAWCNLHGHTLSLQEMNLQGRKASAMCRSRDIVPQPVSDPRFGTVNSYPDRVLSELNWGAI